MGREEVIRLYGELKMSHPQLPTNSEISRLPTKHIFIICTDLTILILQDILTAVREDGHLMCAFPTGCGKSLPMLLLGLLMPEGK